MADLDAPPVFVVGSARSGTTWVLDAYRTHPLVAGVFESKLFARPHGLSGLLHDDHWSGRRSGLGVLTSRDEVVEVVRELASGWLAGALRPEHRFLVEKTPGQQTDFESSGRLRDETGFYRGGRVGDWRRSFNLLDGIVFNAFAGEALVELGYEHDRRWRAPLRRMQPLGTTN